MNKKQAESQEIQPINHQQCLLNHPGNVQLTYQEASYLRFQLQDMKRKNQPKFDYPRNVTKSSNTTTITYLVCCESQKSTIEKPLKFF